MSHIHTIRVAILTYPNAALFELGCAVELFALSRPEFEHWYQADVVSFETGALAHTGGIMMQVKTVKNLVPYDMLVIPSWPCENGHINADMAQAIQRFNQQGKRIISFCSGAFLLAHLGLLQQRRATTHWRYAERFQQLFPEVEYVADILYEYNGQIGCSAGSAAALDLGLEVIRQDHGQHIANQVARRLVVSAHRQGGQSQYVEIPRPETSQAFGQAIDWARSNLIKTIDINQFADRAHMSRRSFDRHFRNHFNQSPGQWLTQQRLFRARELLEQETQGMERVAEQSGFNNAITLRHHFRKLFGISPTQYRQQFQMK